MSKTRDFPEKAITTTSGYDAAGSVGAGNGAPESSDAEENRGEIYDLMHMGFKKLKKALR